MSISFLIFPVDFAGNLHGFPARPISPSLGYLLASGPVAELFSRRAFAPGKSVALTVFFFSDWQIGVVGKIYRKPWVFTCFYHQNNGQI